MPLLFPPDEEMNPRITKKEMRIRSAANRIRYFLKKDFMVVFLFMKDYETVYVYKTVIMFPNEFAYSIADTLPLGSQRSGTKFVKNTH